MGVWEDSLFLCSYFSFENVKTFGLKRLDEIKKRLDVSFDSSRRFGEFDLEPIAKATFAYANQNRDYRIFEDFAFYIMKEACEKRVTNIL